MTSSNGPSAAVPVPPGRTDGAPAVLDREDLPDRVWTLPNALSVLRLLGVPVFLWLLLGPEEDGWALVILMVSGFTDWLDGKLARWLNQGSRLGALLDPAADRLYIVATLVALAIRDVIPVWVVALLVGRELVLGVMLLVLRHYGYPPLQVHYLGKAATLAAPLRLPGAADRRRGGLAGRARRALRVGPHHLGDGALPAGRGVLRRPGGGDRAGRADGVGVAVTGTPRGGAPRSLGASLLDDVLAETLDPAYAQAAAAREAGRPPAWSPWRGRVLVALTMVIAGLLVAVAYDQAAAGAEGREQVREALIDDIDRESAVSDELSAQLEDLSRRGHQHPRRAAGRQRRGPGRPGRAGAAPSAARPRWRSPARACWSPWPTPTPRPTTTRSAGRPRKTPAAGYVTATSSSWSTPSGPPAPRRSASTASDSGPLTAIRFAGEAVLVDFRPVINPYEISAIGDPDSWPADSSPAPRCSSLAVISESFGLRFDFSRKDELTLPAASTPELRIAVPEAPAGDAPATDPTPGG